jgi:hypothetical protein
VLGENGLSPDAFGLVVTDEARTSAQEHSKTLAAAIGEYRARNPGATVHPLVCKLLGAGDDGVTWIPPDAPSGEPLALGYVPDEVVADALIQAGLAAICERGRFEEPMTYLRMSLRVARALQWECPHQALTGLVHQEWGGEGQETRYLPGRHLQTSGLRPMVCRAGGCQAPRPKST